jgi:hypothetical protein
MELRQSLGMRQDLEQKLEQKLVQTIDFAKTLVVPDEVMSVVISAIAYNPEAVESILGSGKSASKSYTANKVQSIYSSILPSGESQSTDSKKRGGIILSPDLTSLQSLVANFQVEVTPDVTYVARKDKKPEIVFSDHITGSMALRLLIVDASRFPNTARLFEDLKFYDQWKREKLRQIYPLIGNKQREFFEQFDYTRLTIYPTRSLVEEVKLSESTLSRILSNRWVEARNLDGDQQHFYIKDLLVTADDVLRFHTIPRLNEVLQHEFENKRALSDEDIHSKIKSVQRRTIAKYRMSYQIPDKSARKKLYLSGERTEPYYLENGFNVKSIIE